MIVLDWLMNRLSIALIMLMMYQLVIGMMSFLPKKNPNCTLARHSSTITLID